MEDPFATKKKDNLDFFLKIINFKKGKYFKILLININNSNNVLFIN